VIEAAVDRFIEEYAKPRQRTWDQTERVLKRNCAEWLNRPISEITKNDARTLLRGFIAKGQGPKAGLTRAWLKKLWRWCYEEDLVANPIMEAVKIEYSKKKRNRVYSDDDIRKVWKAADNLDPIESAFMKLMILLFPRKTTLASMRRAEVGKRKIRVLDADGHEVEQILDIWTTPPERVKQSKRAEGEGRTYETPLPALALRILKSLPKNESDKDDRVFPGLPVSHSKKTGKPTFGLRKLARKLAVQGAPAHFKDHADYHAWRHTATTWLQNEGHMKEERPSPEPQGERRHGRLLARLCDQAVT
jgi:integrase